jgi:hypothetical protein
MDEQWCGFHNVALAFITSSCTTFIIVATLLDVKLPTAMLSTSQLLSSMFDVVKSKKLESIPPALSMTSTLCSSPCFPLTIA